MKIAVYAPVGSFGSVGRAAVAEDSLDWQLAPNDDHRACILSFAAVELQEHLNRVPEIVCDVMPLDLMEAHDDTVASVSISTLADSGEAVKDAPEQGYCIRTDSEGNDNRCRYSIIGNDAQGALYGAYELLHRFGFRWFSPDPWDQVTPERISFDPISLTENPSFTLRGFWATDDRGTEAFLLWMARNKLNLWSAEQPEKGFCRKLGIRFTTGGHSIFARYADPKRYFEEHPEWYGLQAGGRSKKIDENVGDNICIANAEVRHHIAEALAHDLAEGEWKWVDLINVWALDNGTYCTCDECANLGNPTDQIMLLANDCRKSIVAARNAGLINREVIVSIPAYHETLDIPSRELPADFDHDGIVATFFPIERCFVHTFTDSGCTEINQPLLEFWENWTRNSDNPFKGSMLVGEYYNVSAYASLAIPASRTMAADIPYYYRSGARLMHFMHIGTALWGTLALTNTQFAAMLWNHELEVDAFLADYFANRYGDRSAAATEAYDTLERAMLNAKPLKHYAGMDRHTLRSTIKSPKSIHAVDSEPADKHVAHSNAISFEDALFTTRHLRYGRHGATTESGPSLTESLDALMRVERSFDDELLSSIDPMVRRRIRLDLRRVRYTRYSVEFSYHAVRLRMFELMDDAESAALEARALEDVGETLRRETEMPKLKPDAEVEDWHRFYRNGLTATWLSEFYEETMDRYGLSHGDGSIETGEVL